MIRVYCYAKEFFWQLVALALMAALAFIPAPAKPAPAPVTRFCLQAEPPLPGEDMLFYPCWNPPGGFDA